MPQTDTLSTARRRLALLATEPALLSAAARQTQDFQQMEDSLDSLRAHLQHLRQELAQVTFQPETELPAEVETDG